MKRKLLLVFTVSAIPLVEAFTLFGEEVSMIVLVPLIVIFVFLVIFIFMIVRDKIREKSINNNMELGTLPEPVSTNIPAEEVTLTENKVEEMELKPVRKPKKDYLEEIELLERKVDSMDIEEANKQVNDLIKIFFSDYIGVNYEFTFEELEKELKKRNEKIICFPDRLSSINYNPRGLSREDLIQLIREFKNIVASVVEKEQQITPEFKKEEEEKKDKIKELLKKGEKLILSNPREAVGNYRKIFDLYGTLEDGEKAIIKPLIMDFYGRLKL